MQNSVTPRRIAVITGGTRGIGRATAALFAEKGWTVFILYRENDPMAEELCSQFPNISAIKADVSDINAVYSAREQIGHADVLINNAGISYVGLLTDMSEAEWDKIMSVNLKSVFNTCKAFVPSMVKAQKGSIVNISSVWGICGASCEVAYSASKAAVIGFTKALAKELAPSGIRVNCVAPGVVDTDMNAVFTADERSSICEEIPLGRFGTPEEIARSVFFMTTEEYVTGQILSPNGGYVI